MNTHRQSIEAVRTAARNPYAWPGGYPIVLLMYDGEVLCNRCLKGNYRMILKRTHDQDNDDWTAVGLMVLEGTEEDYGPMVCAHCGERQLSPPEDPPPPPVENTRDRRRMLAEHTAREMELSDLIDFAVDGLMTAYENDQELFQEHWREDNDE